jgi:hypothetical protein
VIGSPKAVTDTELSGFCLNFRRSARIVIVPCVITTLPARLPTFVW